jgi:hypothetical protein
MSPRSTAAFVGAQGKSRNESARLKIARMPAPAVANRTGTEFAAVSSTGSATATSSDRTQCTLLSTKGEPTRRRQIAEALGRVRI